MRTEPRGYWTRVFDQAACLLRARPDLNGDAAYWMARRLVDQTLVKESPLAHLAGTTIEPAPLLVLAS